MGIHQCTVFKYQNMVYTEIPEAQDAPVILIGKILLVAVFAGAIIRIEKVAPVAPYGNTSTFKGPAVVLTNMNPLTLLFAPLTVLAAANEPVVRRLILW